jgi:hypothetical protein
MPPLPRGAKASPEIQIHRRQYDRIGRQLIDITDLICRNIDVSVLRCDLRLHRAILSEPCSIGTDRVSIAQCLADGRCPPGPISFQSRETISSTHAMGCRLPVFFVGYPGGKPRELFFQFIGFLLKFRKSAPPATTPARLISVGVFAFLPPSPTSGASEKAAGLRGRLRTG